MKVPFLKEERNLIDNLANIISGSATKKILQQLLYDNTERLKELRGINQTSQILRHGKSIEESLQEICNLLPDAWQYPVYTCARIIYDDKEFKTDNFKITQWLQKQTFETPSGGHGSIEIYYLKEFPLSDEGPFMKEERNLINNLSIIISGSASKNVLTKLIADNTERLKELSGINQTAKIIALGLPVNETLQRICLILPKSWQYPDYTAVRIKFEGKVFSSCKFKETKWVQKENFITIDNKKGYIEVFYLKKFPYSYEGPFLKEERDLLYNIGKLITGYLNDIKGRDILNIKILTQAERTTTDEYRISLIKNKQPLQQFFNRQIIDKYIYLDMMRNKIKEILFVATLYDAFILENEEAFFEQFMGGIYPYGLFSLPRITGVSSEKEALEILQSTKIDLVIIMVGLEQKEPVDLSRKIKKRKPDIPVYLLLNNKINAKYFEELVPNTTYIDKLFYWTGNSQIIFTIVKIIEDKANVENDTQVGLVRVILLIEDSAFYYSRFLPILYSVVFGQSQKMVEEAGNDELDKLSKIRSRPKVMLATNYEEAVYIFNKYKDFLLCVLSDIEFEREGTLDKTAGLKFIKYAKSQRRDLPVVLQSSESQSASKAFKLNAGFINKNSDSLLNDLKGFLTFHLGFGDFIFRDSKGKKIGIARTLRDFETQLKIIPTESIHYHAKENQFSLWLMAHGEIDLAKQINPIKVDDSTDVELLRNDFLKKINVYREEKKKGRVIRFEDTSVINEKNIISIAQGSLGGKGRGLAFINTLINNVDFKTLTDTINICTPRTVIIGTDEYDTFIEKNSLREKIVYSTDYQQIKSNFIKSRLSNSLIKKLKDIIVYFNKPLAIRSSSLSEDSLTQPFAGIFDTIILPNNSPDNTDRLNDVINATKLVYASIYSPIARKYFEAIGHKVEEEKMAIVIQELVGRQYENYFYPHLSGVAQSYNYYPIAHMKPEEGFAIVALGLGIYIVDGGNSYRFSPKYPKTEIYTFKDLLKSTQLTFCALDLDKKNVDYFIDGPDASLAYINIDEAERHGTLKHCASVFDINNNRIESGLTKSGPRILNFANILKYDYIPLAETIDILLNIIKKALGAPVEIEYAVDLTKNDEGKSTFYLLQIKPLIGKQFDYHINLNEVQQDKIVLHTKFSMGNGKIDDLYDVIYVDPKRFDKLKTLEIAKEIEELNEYMNKFKKKYMLIGPGRWGSSDRFLGIPVNWSQISNAQIIVEMSLPNFPLDASLGSHFFHNVISMNVGYLSILNTSSTDFIRWDILESQKVIKQKGYVKLIRFDEPITIIMDGKERMAVVLSN